MFHSGLTFFGQPPSNRAAIHEELFNIAYYGNGFNHNELYNMPVPLRRFYAQKLIDAKEKEKKQYEEAVGKSSSEIGIILRDMQTRLSADSEEHFLAQTSKRNLFPQVFLKSFILHTFMTFSSITLGSTSFAGTSKLC